MDRNAGDGSLPPLWTCPKRGKSYVTRNLWHSCVVVPLERHFEGRPAAGELFAALLTAMEREGPVTVSVSKTQVRRLAPPCLLAEARDCLPALRAHRSLRS